MRVVKVRSRAESTASMTRTRGKMTARQEKQFKALVKALATNVKKHRAAAELTQEDLAERSGISVRYVQQIESGERIVTLRTGVMIAGALGITLSELLKTGRK